MEGLARRLAFSSQPACQPRSGRGSWGDHPGGSSVFERKAVCAAVTAAAQSAFRDLPLVTEEIVESGLADVTARKGRLAGQPGVIEQERRSLSAGVRRAEMGRC